MEARMDILLLCNIGIWEISQENIGGNIFGTNLTRPAGRTAGSGPALPRFSRIVFDSEFRHCITAKRPGFIHMYFGRHSMVGTGVPRYSLIFARLIKEEQVRLNPETWLMSKTMWRLDTRRWSIPPPPLGNSAEKRRSRTHWPPGAEGRGFPEWESSLHKIPQCSILTWRWFSQGSPPSSSRTAVKIGKSLVEALVTVVTVWDE